MKNLAYQTFFKKLMNHPQTQTIKIEATEQEAKLWKDKANAISLSRNDYLLSLLRRRDNLPKN